MTASQAATFQLLVGVALLAVSLIRRGRYFPESFFPRDALFITTYVGGVALVTVASINAA